MIQKVLIANRGEIAARIIRTCKKMNMNTVAIYSEADRNAAYVSMANESYEVGPARAQESYLHMDRILAIAKKSGADAIHPGYGFLSENAPFAKRCEQEGFVFIGPSHQIIELMGDKIAARKAMQKAGVPIIPGTDTAIEHVDDAMVEAKKIGYPMMVKASAGGGGVGMEVVHTEEELVKAIETNTKRAESLFGDGSLFLEKQIVDARHIEVQVSADSFNNAIHLFDRECSIQRRNQKVIEEAPSSLPDDVRIEMGRTSVQACKDIGYSNVGTIEFLVDKDNHFYFLEMNTRIQVEHPVTEEITGVDLVRMQVEIAQGKRLSVQQEDLAMNGHAIEVRLYAEDPETFFPSPGTISTCDIPTGENIRLEMSVKNHTEVTPFYDPMIGKIIVSSNTREQTIQQLTNVLNETTIDGIKTNIPMLQKVFTQEAFIKGDITTDYVKRHL